MVTRPDGHAASEPTKPIAQRREVTSVPATDRPVDRTPVHTANLPPTPQRDRTIPASAWIEAPPDLLALGERFGGPGGLDADSVAGHEASFLRRIGPWLLWRAGPARRAEASYWTARADDLTDRYTFALFSDGSGDGTGPSGERHTRFRAWKEDLRDHD